MYLQNESLRREIIDEAVQRSGAVCSSIPEFCLTFAYRWFGLIWEKMIETMPSSSWLRSWKYYDIHQGVMRTQLNNNTPAYPWEDMLRETQNIIQEFVQAAPQQMQTNAGFEHFVHKFIGFANQRLPYYLAFGDHYDTVFHSLIRRRVDEQYFQQWANEVNPGNGGSLNDCYLFVIRQSSRGQLAFCYRRPNAVKIERFLVTIDFSQKSPFIGEGGILLGNTVADVILFFVDRDQEQTPNNISTDPHSTKDTFAITRGGSAIIPLHHLLLHYRGFYDWKITPTLVH